MNDFEQIWHNTIYNDYYYVAIIVILLYAYKVFIKMLIKEKCIKFNDMVGLICIIFFMLTPIINQALAIVLFFDGFIRGLDLHDGKILLKWGDKDESKD